MGKVGIGGWTREKNVAAERGMDADAERLVPAERLAPAEIPARSRRNFGRLLFVV